MNKKGLVESIYNKLKEANYRKTFVAPRHTFHVSDDDGNCCDFNVRQVDKSVAFSQKDVSAFLDAYVDAVEEALKNGEEVFLYGFGSFAPHYRSGRTTTMPGLPGEFTVESCYVPRFAPGRRLKLATKLWGVSKEDSKDSKA